MIPEKACGVGPVRTNAVRISLPFYSLPQSCTDDSSATVEVSSSYLQKVSTAIEISHWPVLMTQFLQNKTIQQGKYRSILNATPQLQVHSGTPENTFAAPGTRLYSLKGAWKHRELHRSPGEVDLSVWEVFMWLLDSCTCCWCRLLSSVLVSDATRALAASVMWPNRS